MARVGNKILDLTERPVREQLVDETNPKTIKRPMAAREYLEGLSPADIEAKYGWNRQTVYNWLNRFEERGVNVALFDKSRLGRLPNSATNSLSNSLLYSMNYLKNRDTTI